MQLISGTDIYLDGVAHTILYIDDVEARIEEFDTKRRQTLSRERIDEAYVAGDLIPYEVGFEPQVWKNNAATSMEFASEYDRKIVERKLPYARYFAENSVGISEQYRRCAEIAEQHGHDIPPSPSTARRWASLLIAAKYNPIALIDGRSRTTRDIDDE